MSRSRAVIATLRSATDASRDISSTCDPDDFLSSAGYSLRQKQYGRKTDLLIAMTYYNESRELVAVSHMSARDLITR